MIISLVTRSLGIILVVTMIMTATSTQPQNTASPVMTLVVDERQAARRIAFVHEEIRIKPGSQVLAYPRWIPGENGPTGPIQQLASLRLRSGDAILPWTRDPEDIYSIHLEVPPKADRITVEFDTLLENTISDHQLLLAWNTAVLYPRGIDKTQLIVEPTIILPPHWKQGSTLQVTGETEGRLTFAPISLERLIDSPVLAGEFLRVMPLPSIWPAELDVTGDSQSAVDKADDAHAATVFAKLIDQDRAMFGFRHWQSLHLLISQSDSRPFDGLEHEDSPYAGVGDAGLSNKRQLEKLGWVLLAHEQSHSWNGKYRRPAEMYSKPDYQGPERSSMLWVYEGLNQYIGMLLATRAGFNDADYMRDYLARAAAEFASEPGRSSTALVDTATEDWVLRAMGTGWSSLRRGQDYYDEGALIWLRADTIIRERTHDQLALDDFLRSFFGQNDSNPVVVPYTRVDVEASLSAICPYDWHAFFESHVYWVNNLPPTDGLEAAGWRLVFSTAPNNEPFYSDFLAPGSYYAWYSIGMGVKKDGTISDVIPGTPAYEAGLGPKMKILAIDAHPYSNDALNDSISHPRNGSILLVVRNFDSIETHEVKYAGGARYPHLERIAGTHDYLSEIFQPRTFKDQ